MAEKGGKIVVDPIYGMIELDPLAVKIIDTHYFQRLRYIKQLSFGDFVYPGATHTRFAHSIGVYHLACEMIKRIKSQGLKDVGLTDKEERCIPVAALCHDMGHGPFSHAYENIFGKELQGVKHESISEFLVERMFKDNDNFGLEEDDIDIGLIQALIQGNYKKYENDPNMKAKKYMFQIVSNKTSGIDVDKWDYFNRDAIACGVPERFQFDRALHVVRVVKVNGVYELGYRDHDAFTFYNMYNTRFTLYRKVYRHRVVVAVELMVNDVFHLVRDANKNLPKSDEGLTIEPCPVQELTDPTEQCNNKKLGSKDKDGFQLVSEPNANSAKSDKCVGRSIDNKYLMIEDYLKLRDDILLKIQDSKDERYQKAQKLIQKIHTRKLYKLIEEFKVINDVEATQTEEPPRKVRNDVEATQTEEPPRKDQATQTEEDTVTLMQNDLNSWLKEDGLKDEFKIKVETFNYGKGEDDPVQKMYFYRKGPMGKPEKLKRKEVSFVLPNIFQEHYIRVYETFSQNTDYTKDNKEQLKNGLDLVLQKFEEKYQGNLVMKQKQDAVPTERVTSTPSMSNVNKEDLPDSKE